MGAMVYDCKESVEDLVSRLRSEGASDREIANALREVASEIEYTHWGRDDW